MPRIVADSCRASFDELDGVETYAAVESAAVVGQAPCVDHLVGEKSAGEGERQRQSSEAVSDLRSVFDRPGMRSEVAEYKGGILTWEHAELQ
ncbi:hypothetical protein [Streptomyces sp. NPDC005244]|uniref:hypothetical protein n=1 Tax=Streptomyces sp. NPDC005244 TaxID=3364708 RepID=UPI0036B75D72